MSEISVFDIIGPIMIGPSSSHTAGALKIARIAGLLASDKIADVTFRLYGSFAKTYHGHGTDRALVGGILGYDTDDDRIRFSFDYAKKAGMTYSFVECDEPNDYHPNTVVITTTEANGTKNVLRGASVGGGEIEINEINGCKIDFSGKYNAVVVEQQDKPGVVAGITKVLEEEAVNIANMRVYRESRGDNPFSIIEVDGGVGEQAIEKIRALPHVLHATYLRVH